MSVQTNLECQTRQCSRIARWAASPRLVMTSRSSHTPPIPIATTDLVRPGEILVGKFRVERVVGRGGMGLVVEATNLQLDQKVALKLLAQGADDPAIVERFSHEARAAARLRSEHVARVYDVGQDSRHGPFIVMEMLEGHTLAEVLSSSGSVQLHRAVEYIIDACEGLAEAHARGIIHFDVKPANLFLVSGSDGKPTIKLLDFGIAAVRTKERQANTTSSQPTMGTPAYLAPEQLRGLTLDHRVDIWSLGCVLYELLVGERPFRAGRFTELVTKILETEPEPIPDDLEIPPRVRDAVLRCLDKDSTKRFASTGELALTLLPFARRRAHSAVTRAVAHVKSGGLDPHLQMPSSMPPPPSSEVPPDVGPIPRLRTPNFDGIHGAAPIAGVSDDSENKANSSNSIRPSPTPKRRTGLIILAIGLVVGLGLAAFGALSWRRHPTEAVDLLPPPTSSPATTVLVAPPTSERVTSAPTSSATPEASVSSSRPTPVNSQGRLQPPAGFRPRTTSSGRPGEPSSQPRHTGESEIRHTR